MSKKMRRKHKIKHLLLIVVAFGLFTSGILIVWASSLSIPDFESFNERKIAQSTKIYDSTGEVLLYDIHKDIKRRVVTFEDIHRNIKNATVAIEDSEFYDHNGIKPTAILRAFFVNIFAGETKQGGSTITQQVIKNALLTKEKKLARKIKEAVLSIKLENMASKEEILTLYLNEAPYGGSIYGVEEASQAFFGKNATDVTLSESAYLASLPKAPTYYSPYGTNKSELNERKNVVLARMLELDFISEDEYVEALNEEVVFNPQADFGIRAPHFVTYIRSLIEEKYGVDFVETQGLKITTTLNWEIQQKAEEIISSYSEQNIEKFNANNAGLVAIDPKTGFILSMVGSYNYFDNENEGNFNITLAHRQPGSSFKPFVYATAFKKGFTPETIVFDLETQFSTTCDFKGEQLPNTKPDTCYTPQNYDNIFRGPVSFREALAQSINVPAVKVLYLAGLSDSLKTARDLGIRGLNDENRYGLTLVLGGGEVSLLEMTGAYSVFANDGIRNQNTSIIKIEDKNGNIIEEYEPKPIRVLDEKIARSINNILSDNNARSPAFGFYSPLYIPGRDVAAKTGTTNDYRDAWIIGYTPNLSVGIWSGNNNNTPMEKNVAGFIVAPVWKTFMDEVLPSIPPETFIPPDTTEDKNLLKPILRGVWIGGESYFIDSISGKLSTNQTPKELVEEKFISSVHSILFWVNKNNPNGEQPISPEKDSQFDLWEPVVRQWVIDQKIIEGDRSKIPTEFDDIHKTDSIKNVEIISPKEGIVYPSNNKINIQFNSESIFQITQVDYFLNGIYLGTGGGNSFSFSPNTVKNLEKQNILLLQIYDSVRNKFEKSVSLSVSI